MSNLTLSTSARGLVDLTTEEGWHVRSEDVVEHETVVRSSVTVALLQDEFDALVSFTFNLGTATFRRSRLLQLINSGDLRSDDRDVRLKAIAAIEAAFARSTPSSVGSEYVPSLTGRRGREAEKFLREARAALAEAPRP